jgi:mannose-6-phosphate isomerase-like protein (cupin superfamily)
VLEGEVAFFDEAGNRNVLKPYQGIMIPRGAYYRYLNTGPGNLMVLRVGAGTKNEQNEGNRIGPNGQPLHGDSAENKHVEPAPIPGKFFGA